MKAAAIATVALFIIFGLSSLFPMSGGEAEKLTEELQGLTKGNVELNIFSNNLAVSLLAYIPFAGPVIMGYAVFNTGRYIGWLSAQSGLHPIILVSASIIALYGVLEFLGYGVATAESITLSYYIIRSRRMLRGEVKMLLVCLAASTIFLLAGALIEGALIRALKAPTTII